MSGGLGTLGATITGALVIGILSDGLVMMGVSSFWQMVIKGLVIIIAVVVDQAQRRLQQRVALRQMARLGCDRGEARLEAVGRDFGIERRYLDAEDLLASERLDFVDIATTVQSHRPLVE